MSLSLRLGSPNFSETRKLCLNQLKRVVDQSEGQFYQKQKNRLRKEQDQIHDRISKMYDDRYDGKIDGAFFQKKLKEYKDREFTIIQEMEAMPRQTKVSMSQLIWS